MGILKKSLGIAISISSLSSTSYAYTNGKFNYSTDLIYGKDNRVEIEQYHDQDFIEKSASIAISVLKKRLTVDRNDPNRILFPLISLKSALPTLCSGERFTNQVKLGECSGFLVGPQTLVTAGHCMQNKLDCANHLWVFGYKRNTTELTTSQVYSCKKIISQRYVDDEKEVSDYAVIKLDRPVEGYVPLERRKFGRALINTPLVVIGHPLGLPMKATDGATVNRMNDKERQSPIHSFIRRANYFTTNLDSYGGNSGSPVFNKNNGQVEGIIIQGETDFFYNPMKECHESRRLSDSHHTAAEKVMRINKIPGL
jgi:V8-like Glu-specific endopeptidase